MNEKYSIIMKNIPRMYISVLVLISSTAPIVRNPDSSVMASAIATKAMNHIRENMLNFPR